LLQVTYSSTTFTQIPLGIHSTSLAISAAIQGTPVTNAEIYEIKSGFIIH